MTHDHYNDFLTFLYNLFNLFLHIFTNCVQQLKANYIYTINA